MNASRHTESVENFGKISLNSNVCCTLQTLIFGRIVSYFVPEQYEPHFINIKSSPIRKVYVFYSYMSHFIYKFLNCKNCKARTLTL